MRGVNEREQHRELVAGQRPHLLVVVVDHPLAVRQRGAGARVVAQHALPHRRGEARPHRVQDVAHRRVRQRPPIVLRRVAQPRDELGDVLGRHVAHTPLPEERNRVLAQQPPVLVARALAEPAPARPLVALDPRGRVLRERLARSVEVLAARNVGGAAGLELRRLGERARALPALAAVSVR